LPVFPDTQAPRFNIHWNSQNSDTVCNCGVGETRRAWDS